MAMSTLENLTKKASGLKDFENLSNLSIQERAAMFYDFFLYNNEKRHSNYRIISHQGSGSKMYLQMPYSKEERECISFVSNDYLGFTKHPKVINAGIEALKYFGSGAGSSPLIGGQSYIHDQLEKEISKFFKKEAAITYTSGYAANSGTLMALLQKEDIAILDMGVHTSVIEGCMNTNKKFFLHNNASSLEQVLLQTANNYKNTVIIIDGIYSQDGDIAPLREICTLARKYNAFLVVDDAHGIGVVGQGGRGVVDMFDLYHEVDMITGTFSKSLGSVGGFVVANKEIITYLKFYAASNIFSAAATPQSVATVLKSLELLEQEPQWQAQLQSNISYFRKGLEILGIDFGKSESAIFPIMIRDEEKTKNAGRFLLENNIYGNPIMYPAVSRKQTRMRMSVLATHTESMLDKCLDVLDRMVTKFDIPRFDN
jgi:glycine C-acetyltransferase